ncbi:MAG TPA: hypothetical protein VFT65_01910 [Candidatus Angelobacter sp.]|nr:hypothetical protein [Candidatus Angelobacter sp.]
MELRLAAHHPGVRLPRLLERTSFNYGTDAGKFGEVQRVLGVRRRARRPTLKGSTSNDELMFAYFGQQLRTACGKACQPMTLPPSWTTAGLIFQFKTAARSMGLPFVVGT